MEHANHQLRKQFWEDTVQTHQKDELEIEKVSRQSSLESDNEHIHEIKDIYDHIYGNVRTKRVFYEKQNSVPIINDKVRTEIKTGSESIIVIDKAKEETLQDTFVLPKPISEKINDIELEDSLVLLVPSIPNKINAPAVDKEALDVLTSDIEAFTNSDNCIKPYSSDSEDFTSLNFDTSLLKCQTAENTPSNPDLLNECQISCSCQKLDFVTDRSEILDEINTNLKLELEAVRKRLKEEMLKTNELNFEIANIESVLETYYKEARNQKSVLASIYSTMKTYVSENINDFQETYTFKRIKMIANYMDSLKTKLEHQDKIIKNNFIENPYYTDLIVKYDAILKQLDEMSLENIQLKEIVKMKEKEELDTIKELNRQKFQLEDKCREIENSCKRQISEKDVEIESLQLLNVEKEKEFQAVLDHKEKVIKDIEEATAARINNYKQELVIVYRKWRELKKKV